MKNKSERAWDFIYMNRENITVFFPTLVLLGFISYPLPPPVLALEKEACGVLKKKGVCALLCAIRWTNPMP